MFWPLTDSRGRRPPEGSEASDDFTMIQSLADGQKPAETPEVPDQRADQILPDESDSTKSRRLADDYDSTKNRMEYSKYQGTKPRPLLIEPAPFYLKPLLDPTGPQFYNLDHMSPLDPGPAGRT